MVELNPYEAVLLSFGALVFGIFLLVRGGGWTIDSAVHIATQRGLSPMFVGFVIVGFGTSLPELIVSLLATLQGSAGIALGNVIGSNIANILLILGLSAAIAPLVAQRSVSLSRDLVVMVLSTFWLGWLLNSGGIARWSGFLMIFSLLVYVGFQFLQAKRDQAHEPRLDLFKFDSDAAALFFLVCGLLSIAVGAEFLVKGAKTLAIVLAIPESVIALSIVAVGTSLPELTTSIIASRRGQTDLVIGNVIGSNVFNILMILGITGLMVPVSPGTFSPQLAAFDVWFALVVALVFAALLFASGKITQLCGFLFCLMYVVYNIYIYTAHL
ncbi:MAG: calcium/sodium antiporter [Alphaproteobacteria bacterium]|nr:calcium/sodium antiporter [Alphaproteobacteria bacterium]MBP7758132.1 calcium/sodium antiporter [Alphaproteobacteria bacterium]MBP7761435.1 calcium/sodium antiporter [Alphaproteobacteria bacterium]MBP7903830.1 calcium/sodium antiporter [Alphaproteobacteria bacterium]